MLTKIFRFAVCAVLLTGAIDVFSGENPEPHKIPFKLINNKVAVPVNIGDSRTLNLILDSGFGFDGIILFKGSLADSINLSGRVNAQLPGAGDGPPTPVVMTDSMSFRSGTCEFRNQRIIILQNDKFKDSPTDGVIGYSYFGHYKVEVDYDDKTITLRDPAEKTDESEYEVIPLTFNQNNWPFLNIKIAVEDEEPVELKVYIDYASSLAVELPVKEGMKIRMPEKTEADFEGYGFIGDIKGKTARLSKVILGKYALHNVTATFFEGNSRSKSKEADGVISNDVMRRFNLIFDYGASRLLIKPNNSFDELFEVFR